MSWYTTAIVSITACLVQARKKCTQSGNFQLDLKSPSDFKILSSREVKTLFQKYNLSLQQVITLESVTSCVNIREFSKDTTTADSHENVAWKSEFTFFFQSPSWLFQLSYFVTCKRTLLDFLISMTRILVQEENEFCHCLFTSFTKREIRHFHGQSCSWRQRKCTRKCDARAKLLFCLVKLLLIWLSRRRRILNLWSFKNRIFSGQIELLLLIASQTCFRLIGSSFVSG